MPAISIFFGIVIYIYWSDHNPPHIHARYSGEEAVVAIKTLEVMEGSLPKRAMAMVVEWMREHQEELLEAWDLASRNIPPAPIAPLT
ncbi:MAG: DUF4160 domain-containing protein [Sphingomonadaceae bacterium]